MNMNKQWRDELRTLRASQRKAWKDCNTFTRELDRDIKKHAREISRLNLGIIRAQQRTEKAVAKIVRRMKIVEGRLS